MIKANELAEYEFEHKMCGEHGRGVNKSITARVKHKRIIYVVKNQNKTILETPCLGSAVSEYNEA
tara:strand:+ start:1622 stop:1816 length:195 start_codon:yes stop_codon:yes gene_type:complete